MKPIKTKAEHRFGSLKGSVYSYGDIISPAVDPSEVHANDPSKWDDLL